MATKTTTKKTPAKRSAASKTKNSAKRTPPQKRPIRREVWGVIFLVLTLCVGVSYFHVKAIFIDWLATLIKGLIGMGYFMAAPAFLLSAIILLSHRGRPVRLRVTCTLLMPVLLGCLVHMVASPSQYPSSVGILKTLWVSGVKLKSGGAISGTLAVGSIAVFSKVASIIIFTALLVVLLMISFRLTIAALIEKHRNRPEYEEEPEPEIPAIPRREAKVNVIDTAVPKPVPEKAVIDIPLDGEIPIKAEKRPGFFTGFFRHKSDSQPTPDQVLTAEQKSEKKEMPTNAAVYPPPVNGPVVPPTKPVTKPITKVEKVAKSIAACVKPAINPVQQEASTVVETSKPTPPSKPKPVASTVADVSAEVTNKEDKQATKQEVAAATVEVAQEIEQKLTGEGTEYQYPPIDLLDENPGSNYSEVGAELRNNSRRLGETLSSFGVHATAGEVIHGPTVTRYEYTLEHGVKLSKITNLSDDIALALGASGVRIAPIPNKSSVVGIEVPNKQVSMVTIRDVLSSDNFTKHKSKVSFALGKDIGGNAIIGNIAKLPHVLIAGTTGSGKSVCTNSLIVSMLYKSTPEEVRFIMVDPKMVELAPYNGIPHLLIPVVTDPKKAAGALQWAVFEMMKRYKMFSEHSVKNLEGYNSLAKNSDDLETMPTLVVVIDELADLMLVAAKEVEESICRVAQMGRAAGVHLVIATQRPSADVITGIMKANIPSRIAFAVASSLESRIILDTQGAEKLIGRGDMLFSPVGAGKPTRVQGCMITPEEIDRVVAHVKQCGEANYSDEVMKKIEESVQEKENGGKKANLSSQSASEEDELLPNAVEVILETGQASVSMLQRRLKLGYSRAARLVDQLEDRGIVGPFEGSKPRQLLITRAQWQEMQMEGTTDVADINTEEALPPEDTPEDPPEEAKAVD